MSTPMRHLPPLVMTLALAACAVGPDYHQSPATVPDHFARADRSSVPAATGAPPDPGAGAGVDADSAFWRGFGDAELEHLIGRTLAANLDLRAALSRYDAANALLNNAKFDRYPTITASGQVGHQLLSKDQAFGAPRNVRDTPLSGADINASWELDLFGRVRRGVEAQRAEVQASAADVLAVRVAIEGEVAQTYVELRRTQERLRIARENAGYQKETLTLVAARVAAGRGSDLDAARARSLVESTVSRIAAYEATIGVDEHRLAVLTDQPMDSLIARLDVAGPAPALPGGLDPGAPGELLRRRPDVAAAEQRLHEATARVGVATADLFPRFTLTGMLGSLTDSYGFFHSGSDENLIALGIDWSFLDIGRVRARIAASNANAAEELAQYQQTVLLAMEDTENALWRVSRTREEAAHLEAAATDSTAAASLAQKRFQAGAIDYYEVLDAERARLQARDAAADGALRRDGATIALYEALAGGWPQVIMREASQTSVSAHSG